MSCWSRQPAQSDLANHGEPYSPLFSGAMRRIQDETPPTSPTQSRSSFAFGLRGRTRRSSVSSGESNETARSGLTTRTAPTMLSEPRLSPTQRMFSILRKAGKLSGPPSPTVETRSLHDHDNDPPLHHLQTPRVVAGGRAVPFSPYEDYEPFSDHAYAVSRSPTASRRTSFSAKEAAHWFDDRSGSGCHNRANNRWEGASMYTGVPRSGQATSAQWTPISKPPRPAPHQTLPALPTNGVSMREQSSGQVDYALRNDCSAYSRIKRFQDQNKAMSDRAWPIAPARPSSPKSSRRLSTVHEPAFRPSFDFLNVEDEDDRFTRDSRDAIAPFAAWSPNGSSLASSRSIRSFSSTQSSRQTRSTLSSTVAGSRLAGASFLAFEEE